MADADMSIVNILRAIYQHTEPVQCECRWRVYWRNLANTIQPSTCVAIRPFVKLL